MRNKFLLIIVGSLFFLFFIVFSYIVDNDFLKQFDFNATVRLQDNISRRFDDFFSLFSEVGSFEVLLIILLIALLLQRKIIAGFVTFFLFGLFHLLEIYGKATVENLPPPQFMLRTKHLFEFPQFHVRSEFSYPSGHSGRTIFLSFLLTFFIWRSKRIPVILKIALIGFLMVFDIIMLVSRVYLGEHWTTDVIGGALLGTSLACLSAWWYQLSLRQTKL